MCGIAGEVARGRSADLGAIAKMADSMVPRGPDSGGFWAQDGIAFGHRRLAIIDLSSHGQQPMHDPDLGLTVAFNGCIYNYPQLRQELIGFGRTRLGSAVAPREIDFIDNLPKTRSGKIMRRLLKARELGLPIGDTSTLEGSEPT